MGARGEDIAAEWLERHGYTIVDRNWRCARGEVDIVARCADDLVFVEVKTRSGASRPGIRSKRSPAPSSDVSAHLVPAWFAAHPDQAAPQIRIDAMAVHLDRIAVGRRARRGDRLSDIGRSAAVALLGVSGRLVEVEAHLTSQLPGFSIIGLPDTSLGEARERVRSAAANAGCPLPSRRITVNLTPAAIPKRGSGFDLAIAMAVLAAAGTAPAHLGSGGVRRRARTRRTRPTPPRRDPDGARGAGSRGRAGRRAHRQPRRGAGRPRRRGARRRLAAWRGHRRGSDTARGRRRAGPDERPRRRAGARRGVGRRPGQRDRRPCHA